MSHLISGLMPAGWHTAVAAAYERAIKLDRRVFELRVVGMTPAQADAGSRLADHQYGHLIRALMVGGDPEQALADARAQSELDVYAQQVAAGYSATYVSSESDPGTAAESWAAAVRTADEGPGMTLDELLGAIDDVLDDDTD